MYKPQMETIIRVVDAGSSNKDMVVQTQNAIQEETYAINNSQTNFKYSRNIVPLCYGK